MNLPPDSTASALRVELDAAALARLRELDPEGRMGVVGRVFKAFETSLTRFMGQLESARSAGHATVVSSVAHTLKSSSASVGAMSLSQACAEVERRLRNGEPGDLDAEIERLLAEGRAALAAVKAMLPP